MFPKKKPISSELEDSFASNTQMKESPAEGEPHKAVAPQLLRLDGIKTEPDNTQVNILTYFFLEQYLLINFSCADTGLLVENFKFLSSPKQLIK